MLVSSTQWLLQCIGCYRTSMVTTILAPMDISLLLQVRYLRGILCLQSLIHSRHIIPGSSNEDGGSITDLDDHSSSSVMHSVVDGTVLFIFNPVHCLVTYHRFCFNLFCQTFLISFVHSE